MAQSTVPIKQAGNQLSGAEVNDIVSAVNSKQDLLVSNVTIRTINGASILGSGNLSISTGGSIDAAPTDGSTNAVQSNGVFDALTLKAPLFSPNFTGTVVLPSTTSIGGLTGTKLGFLSDVTSSIQAQINGKQPTLISGSNIKTVNGNSLLGSGDITISSGGTLALDTAPTDGSTNGVQSNGVFDALSLKAPSASPEFTGIPTAPTATTGTNTTQIATTAFVEASLEAEAYYFGNTLSGTGNQVDPFEVSYIPWRKVTTSQRDATPSPQAGYVVYDTTVNKISVHDGTSWKYLSYEAL